MSSENPYPDGVAPASASEWKGISEYWNRQCVQAEKRLEKAEAERDEAEKEVEEYWKPTLHKLSTLRNELGAERDRLWTRAAEALQREVFLREALEKAEAERDMLKGEVEICRGATETEVSTAYRLERDRLREALEEIEEYADNPTITNIVEDALAGIERGGEACCTACGGTGQDNPPPGHYHGLCPKCNGLGQSEREDIQIGGHDGWPREHARESRCSNCDHFIGFDGREYGECPNEHSPLKGTFVSNKSYCHKWKARELSQEIEHEKETPCEHRWISKPLGLWMCDVCGAKKP